MPTASPSQRAAERVSIPITGMNCGSCAARVEQALQGAEGVLEAGVNFATHRATVEFDPGVTSAEELAAAVREAGYGAEIPQEEIEPEQDREQAAREQEY